MKAKFITGHISILKGKKLLSYSMEGGKVILTFKDGAFDISFPGMRLKDIDGDFKKLIDKSLTIAEGKNINNIVYNEQHIYYKVGIPGHVVTISFINI
jgi:uncharacterized protein with ATP-grasp and redox domains